MRIGYRGTGLGIVLGIILLAASAGTGQGQGKGSDLELRVVKYDGLGEEIARHRGKVVLVDFWATY